MTKVFDNVVSYSQAGEDMVLRELFKRIGEGNRTCVEFGAADGIWLSNTKMFRDIGWKSWLFDIEPKAPNVIRAEITPDNVDQVFDEHNVPAVIDLLSIDVDGMDIWIFRRLQRKARVVVIEFNPVIPPHEPLAVPYPGVTTFLLDSGYYHPYYGASPAAIDVVGRGKDMTIVARAGVNVILVKDEELAGTSWNEIKVDDRRDITLKRQWSRVQGHAWSKM